MNAILQAQNAYAPTQVSIRTDRAIEAQLFSQITARLRRAVGQIPVDYPKLVAILHENRQMWTTMAVDVADNDNALPADLRAKIFYLAEFTEQHSRQVIRGTANPEALVDINAAVLRGLNGTGVA